MYICIYNVHTYACMYVYNIHDIYFDLLSHSEMRCDIAGILY